MVKQQQAHEILTCDIRGILTWSNQYQNTILSQIVAPEPRPIFEGEP